MNLAEMVIAAEAHERAAEALRGEIEVRIARQADEDGMAVTKHLPLGHGSVSQRFSKPSRKVENQETLIAYLRGYHPEEVVEVTSYEVRNPAWLKRWLGTLEPTPNGDLHEPLPDGGRLVPGVRFVPGGVYGGIAITISPELKRELAEDALRYALGRQAQMHALTTRREIHVPVDGAGPDVSIATTVGADGTVHVEQV